jgi:hypothetical protein
MQNLYKKQRQRFYTLHLVQLLVVKRYICPLFGKN